MKGQVKIMQNIVIEKQPLTVAELVVDEVKIKHSGKYDYIDTKYEGIKKIINGKGGYLVFLDYGKKDVFDADKGSIIKKQNKTAKRVDTIKEAQKLRAEAELIRSGGDVRTLDGHKLTIGDAIEDYKSTARFQGLNPNYIQMQEVVFRHVLEYFTGIEPRRITSIDIENYYLWQMENGNRTLTKKGEEKKNTTLSLNTINKHKSVMKMFFDYMIESKKYGVKENVVVVAKLPTVTVDIAGKKVVKKKIEYNPRSLTLEELNYTLNDALQNEFDRSIALFIALASLGSLRRGEIVGLKIGKFYHGDYMCVHDDIFKETEYDKDLYINNPNVMMIDTAINYVRGKTYVKLPKCDIIRVSAIPNELRNIADYYMEQRKEIYDIIGKEIMSTDYLYYPLVNLIKGSVPVTTRMTRKWVEYQKRRNKRMIKQGLQPIPEVRLHDLRHTHSNILKENVPASQISYNMGHCMPDANTTKRVYWNDREMKRDNIINYFNDNIKIDWSKVLRKKINDSDKIKLNGSGHLVVARDVIEQTRKYKKKYIYTEDELVQLMDGQYLEYGNNE